MYLDRQSGVSQLQIGCHQRTGQGLRERDIEPVDDSYPGLYRESSLKVIASGVDQALG